ncbi:MAG: hypothetical protein B6I36_02365 [Desulfobacteraceae bacterium 4572_35.1]|nr:MAG: hypothetical protein B6I36_02365 [Desulfobacteraceae bacterium 4572_35.1]
MAMGVTVWDKSYPSKEAYFAAQHHREPPAVEIDDVDTVGKLRDALSHLPDSTLCIDPMGESLLLSFSEAVMIS